MFFIGDKVTIRVPYGPNMGKFHDAGIIVDYMISGMDGVTYVIRNTKGELVPDVSESWIMRD